LSTACGIIFVIIIRHVVHHLTSEAQAATVTIQEAKNLLAKGGVLIEQSCHYNQISCVFNWRGFLQRYTRGGWCKGSLSFNKVQSSSVWYCF